MKNVYFMGIDIGTFESKGVIIDQNCNIIATHTSAHDIENPKPNYFEHDAEKVWWYDFCKISNALIEKTGIKNTDIVCVGASTLGTDCLPVDEQCRPLRKAILYGIDARANKEMEFLTNYYGPDKVKELYGRPLCSSDIAPKILWIKNNESEIYDKTYKFLTGSSYIVAKLTDEYFIDSFLGLASFAPLYNKDGTVNEDSCKLYCRPDQLAVGKPTTSIAGYVTAKAATETGLAQGTSVITGTGDSTAETISTGVLKPGDMMLQFGSSLFMYYCADKLIKDDRVWGNRFIIPGTYSVSAGTNTAGTLTRWFRDNIYLDTLDSQQKSGRNAYEIMLDGLDRIPAGSEGLITLPYFAGERTPINDPFAKGVIFGLTLKHTRDHMYKSALESIGYTIAQHLDIFQEHDLKINKIMAVGGGTKNLPWLQIIADITNQTINTASVTIGASYGDALMAALGAGYFKEFSDFEGIIKPGITVKPNHKTHELYKPYRKIYDGLYLATKEIMHLI